MSRPTAMTDQDDTRWHLYVLRWPELPDYIHVGITHDPDAEIDRYSNERIPVEIEVLNSYSDYREARWLEMELNFWLARYRHLDDLGSAYSPRPRASDHSFPQHRRAKKRHHSEISNPENSSESSTGPPAAMAISDLEGI